MQTQSNQQAENYSNSFYMANCTRKHNGSYVQPIQIFMYN